MNIKIGGIYTYNSHGGCKELAPYDGMQVRVMYSLDETDIDVAETGPMYKVEFLNDGNTADVFADELASPLDFTAIVNALYTAVGAPNVNSRFSFFTDGDMILMKPSALAANAYKNQARIDAIADFIEAITGIKDLTTGCIEDQDSTFNGCFYIDTNG